MKIDEEKKLTGFFFFLCVCVCVCMGVWIILKYILCKHNGEMHFLSVHNIEAYDGLDCDLFMISHPTAASEVHQWRGYSQLLQSQPALRLAKPFHSP